MEDAANISNETTYRELCAIKGLPDHKRRQIGINLSGGIVNSIELCHDLFELPNMLELDRLYGEHRHRFDDAGNERILLN